MSPWAKELGLATELTLFALLISSAYTDVKAGKVYNSVTFPAFLLGLVLAYARGTIDDGQGGRYLINSLAGALLGGGLFAVFYWLGGLAGGDVKLMAAIGALKGFMFTCYALLYTSIVGAILAVGMLIWQGRLWDGLRGSLTMLFSIRRPLAPETTNPADPATQKTTAAARATLPYGVAISVGAMWAWWFEMLHRQSLLHR